MCALAHELKDRIGKGRFYMWKRWMHSNDVYLICKRVCSTHSTPCVCLCHKWKSACQRSCPIGVHLLCVHLVGRLRSAQQVRRFSRCKRFVCIKSILKRLRFESDQLVALVDHYFLLESFRFTNPPNTGRRGCY